MKPPIPKIKHLVEELPRQLFPMPYLCQKCGAESNYGFQGAWYCSGCWQLVFKSWQN